ncbi:hypothetical protein CAPTEDRAFT_195892 [Capitella teleta]|uniref:Uncharacterized protein n=1 Tax=Capitella teleta TaxID=283909 RepID=R7U6W5_CAPTE|nr:hypothetical protein CAPTEDRAFT_195892 [Capitella teleta]|eukprot:ELT98860.1 hypothetical protein CAPTEDRAFT_195892 [Capitella teleta]
MSCCGSPCSLLDKKGGNEGGVVEIERPLIEYAWSDVASPTIMDQLFRNSRYEFEVNWNYLNIVHEIKRFKRKKLSRDFPNNIIKRDLCLFKTDFTNRSNVTQNFTFKTERSTKTTASVNVQTGFQVGGNFNLEFSLPTVASEKIDAFKVTGGLSGQLSITKTRGKTYEESLVWSVDTQVRVSPNQKCCAKLIVCEEEFCADMIVRSTLKCIGDVLPVIVRHKKNRRQKVFEIPQERIPEILGKSGRFQLVDEDAEESGNYAVYCDSKGVFKAVYGAQQDITIDYVEAPPLQEGHDPENPVEEQVEAEHNVGVGAGPIIEEVLEDGQPLLPQP